MPTVTLAAIATSNPMGQQVYEMEIRRALMALSETARDWQFRDVRVAPLRAAVPGARRSPARLIEGAPLPLARTVGGVVYRTLGLVHRLDLRLPPSPGPEVITIHDLPPCRFPDEGTLPRSAAEGARRARMVICPSRFAADEVRELLGVTRIEVIPYGLSAAYTNAVDPDQKTLTALGVRVPFVLHAAGATQRKNLRGLAAAWRQLLKRHRELQLVLCGPPDERRNDTFRSLERVVLPGRLPPETVASLMRRASVVVVPSVYEGFGLPALEAMACGAPVVAARSGALPEVCGEAALLVEPTADELAGGVTMLLGDARRARELREAGRVRARRYSWTVAAETHLEVYASALGA